jgi:hypothetical protein
MISSQTKSAALLLLPVFAATILSGQTLDRKSTKYQKTQKVYDRLTRASGKGMDAPDLVMTAGKPDNPLYLAYFDGSVIRFADYVYDLCTTAGRTSEDCLAVLLGHELGHFYEQDLWKRGLQGVGAIPDSDLAKASQPNPMEIKNAAERRVVEERADFVGGILAFQAGFDPTAQAVALLQRIYKEYPALADQDKNLEDAARPYPSLAERLVIAQDTAKQLHDEFYPAFETGIQLFLVGDYEGSALCFEFIGRTFVGREIFNDAAAAYLMSALTSDPKLAGGYAYPVQIDFDTNLTKKSIERGGDAESLLKKAAEGLNNAFRLDDSYIPAILNQAVVKSLQAQIDPKNAGLMDRAAQLAGQACDLAKAAGRIDWLAQALTLRGILAARAGHKENAGADFAEAAKLGSTAAIRNQSVLAGGPTAAPTAPAPTLSASEQIAQRTPDPPSRRDPFSVVNLRPRNPRNPSVDLRLYSGDRWGARTLVEDGTRYRAILLTTATGYDGASAAGLRLGSTRDELIRLYHSPASVYSARQGQYCLYAKPNLLVFVDAGGKVGGWSLYNVPSMSGN